MSGKVRVLVVDDSAYNRQTIKSILEKDPEIEVVGIAADGVDAMAKTLRYVPDVITLDFEMPEMDGFSFLRWVMQEQPTPVIMVSSYSDNAMTFKALELGAVDFIVKPTRRASTELLSIEKDLLAKVKGVRQLNMNIVSRNVMQRQEAVEKKRTPTPESEVQLLAIGSSTGGPSALQHILSQLPADMPSGVVISQHMPKGFTKPLADRLNKICSLTIKEAEDGEIVMNGTAYICPGGFHMKLMRDGDRVHIVIADAKHEDKYVPSVDIMMLSAAEVYGDKMIGLVLTGMGNDGRAGMIKVFERGAFTIAESEESAIVYGMPQEVVNAGAARQVLSLDHIPAVLRRRIVGERRN